jgi:hypothetical protein
VRGYGLSRVTTPLTPTLSPPGRGSAPEFADSHVVIARLDRAIQYTPQRQ